MRSARFCFAAIALLGLGAPTAAQTPDDSLESYIRLHYTKQEHLIPMRDGVKLFTSIYVPRDTSRNPLFQVAFTLLNQVHRLIHVRYEQHTHYRCQRYGSYDDPVRFQRGEPEPGERQTDGAGAGVKDARED